MNKIRFIQGTLLGAALLPSMVLADLVTLDLLTDSFGGETSFEMVQDPGGAMTPIAFEVAGPNAFSPANPNLNDGFATTGDLVSNTTYMFTWNLAPADYAFTINDSFGDGICCGFGTGGFTLTTPGQTYVSNVNNDPFTGSSRTIDFSIQQVPVPGTLALMGLGLLAALKLTGRRKAK